MDETNPVFENFRNKMRAFGQPIRGTTRRVSASKFLGNDNLEKRIAITPDIVKKYISLGFDIFLSKNYGLHLGISDKEYLDLD